MKFFGHNCPSCGEHRAVSSKTGTARENAKYWFFGTYTELEQHRVCLDCFELPAEDGSDLCHRCDPDGFGTTVLTVSCPEDCVPRKNFIPLVECEVCLETTIAFRMLPCGHKMCTVCFRQWCKLNHTCHMCRALFYVNTDFARTPSPDIPEEVVENVEVAVSERQFPNPYSGLESSTVIELDEEDDIAPRAETPIKRARVRGGKRNIANKPGLCYLKNVPKKKRETAIATLGERPQIGAVDEYFKQEGIRPRGTQIRFVGQGAHVIRRRDWPTSLQWSIVTTHDRARPIGAEDWEHTDVG